MCAQEVSIRLINIINTSYLLGINSLNASDNLIDLIFAHCQRIIPTIDYAISQDNNHGITEASALYIAGNWLKFPQAIAIIRWQLNPLIWEEDYSSNLLVN